MKRLLKALLVMTLFLGLGTAVHAVEPGDMDSIRVVKKVNATGVNPEETFNFTISGGEVKDGSALSAPAFDPNGFSITVGAGANEGYTDIDLPEFSQPGIYEYVIKETPGNLAGMTYDDEDRILVILVVREGAGLKRIAGMRIDDGEKSEDFTVGNNIYKSGSLEVSKKLAGNFADDEDEFTITVTFTLNAGKKLDAEEVIASGADSLTITNDKIVAVYTVKGGENFTILNVPFDMQYEVVESNFGDYTPSYDNNKSGAVAVGLETVVTNTRGRDVETGITLDNMPYLLALTFAIGGLGYVMVRRRKEH